jgi:hypothetical protein
MTQIFIFKKFEFPDNINFAHFFTRLLYTDILNLIHLRLKHILQNMHLFFNTTYKNHAGDGNKNYQAAEKIQSLTIKISAQLKSADSPQFF